MIDEKFWVGTKQGYWWKKHRLPTVYTIHMGAFQARVLAISPGTSELAAAPAPCVLFSSITRQR